MTPRVVIYTNDNISCGGRHVGRVVSVTLDGKETKPSIRLNKHRVYIGPPGNYATVLLEHDGPLYVGGPSDWQISPLFAHALGALT